MNREEEINWLEYMSQRDSERAYDELSEKQKLELLEYTKSK